MATVVELPRLSDTMEEGVVAKWRIKEGDKVKRGQVIAEIETDKATMEFESFDQGIVLKLVAEEGETLNLGAPIAVFGKKDEDISQVLEGLSKAEPANAAPAEPSEPREPAASAPAPSPAADAPAAPVESAAQVIPFDSRIPASPVARKLAREHGLDLGQIAGSGPHGRVVKADVERAMSEGTGKAGPARGAGSLAADRDEHGRPFVSRENTLVKHSQMRKTIAKRMSVSKPGAPHFYLTMKIRMDAAAEVRKQYNEAVDGTKVSYNDLIVSAVGKALRDHPECNCNYTPEGMVHYGNADVGVAVAVTDGLVVPVVRYADQKSLRQISIEVRDMAGRAKEKKLKPEEMTGSTFTVSNLGMFGIAEFSAVVNPGEGAILAIGAMEDTPVVEEGEVRICKVMTVTLSCDHRAIDGATGAVFLGTVQSYLEQPMKLFT
jgi:pyruvate dehydrogenase E2 component (dihydrolipoamide acetyltransferase)